MRNPRTSALTALLVVVLGGLLAGCALGSRSPGLFGPDATTRIRLQFELDDVDSTESIRLGLLAKTPVGTPMDEVEAMLLKARVGEDDPLSWFVYLDGAYRNCNRDSANSILCEFKLDPGVPGFVKEEYAIEFVLDDRHRLTAIRVSTWLKGL